MLATYNQVTEELKTSHERLQSEVSRLHTELASKDRELERRKRLAALGEMAAGLAHEIRNPLQGIQLYADMLEQDNAENPTALRLLEKITAAIRSLDCLVSDVLSFAQNLSANRSWIRLGAVVAQTLDVVDPLCARAEVAVDVADGINDLKVRGDGQLLHRLMLNLMLNAMEATGPNGKIRIDGRRIVQPWEGIEITVSDNGPGLEPEVMDRIFNPFFTTKDTGTGIGLSIVHRIVEAHGGTIAAANVPDGGAVMTVRLPDDDLADEMF